MDTDIYSIGVDGPGSLERVKERRVTCGRTHGEEEKMGGEEERVWVIYVGPGKACAQMITCSDWTIATGEMRLL